MSGSDGEEDRRESNTITVTGERATVTMDDDAQLAAATTTTTTVKQRVDDARFPRSVNRSRRPDDVRRDDAARTLCDVFPGKARLERDFDLPGVRFLSRRLLIV